MRVFKSYCVYAHVCGCGCRVTIHLDVNLLGSKSNEEGRTTKIIDRLVSSAPRKIIREIDFSIPMMTRDIVHKTLKKIEMYHMTCPDHIWFRIRPKWSKFYLQWKAFIKATRKNFLAVSLMK